jgi:hypothetical protein
MVHFDVALGARETRLHAETKASGGLPWAVSTDISSVATRSRPAGAPKAAGQSSPILLKKFADHLSVNIPSNETNDALKPSTVDHDDWHRTP